MRTELKNIDTAADLTSFDYFIGTRDNQNGTYTDYKFTYAQIAALAQGSNKQFITVAQNGADIADVFFESNIISEIDTNGQVYLRDVDFTQDEAIISGSNGLEFRIGQIILAKV